MYTKRKERKLDPDNTVQMDAFNDEYAEACKMLGIGRETLNVTFEQAAQYLVLSPRTVQRYAYAVPRVLELSHVGVDCGLECLQKRAMVALDSVVEYKVWPRFNKIQTRPRKKQ